MISVTHRRYVPYSHAHYAGHLVDGAYSLGLFGDVATEVCIRLDGDEGLFASYSDVQFRAPVRAGDVLEVVATIGGSSTSAADSPRPGAPRLTTRHSKSMVRLRVPMRVTVATTSRTSPARTAARNWTSA